MSQNQVLKLVPRNAPAFRKAKTENPLPRLVAGNPISTRLESGVGNCYPGLECDLRNLERRFFPYLLMDMPDNEITLVSVDMPGVQKAKRRLEKADYRAYQTLADNGPWTVRSIQGDFGPLGHLTFDVRTRSVSAGPGRPPIDPWTAVRLLTEGSKVTLVLQRSNRRAKPARVRISAKRARYLGDDGALAAMFTPGELTQSLCSPWTHDFRDCGCFYWASNHPDIAMPPVRPGSSPKSNQDLAVIWERKDREDPEPKPATATVFDDDIMNYFAISRDWTKLNFVVERREQVGDYVQRAFNAEPLPHDQLIPHLRYAAGIELAVLQEYLTAYYSLKPDAALAGELRDDVRAARAEIMRIAIGEMRHIRAINTVLASIIGRPGYVPALGIATRIPAVKPGKTRPVTFNPLTKQQLKKFIAIEAPSESVDSVYARILATMLTGNRPDDIQAIRTVMAEGEDHFRTFLGIQEWLGRHDEPDYLRSTTMNPPAAATPVHQKLQREYVAMLDELYEGYAAGIPQGASSLNTARNGMIGKVAIAAEAVAARGFLVVFDIPQDPRFRPIAPP